MSLTVGVIGPKATTVEQLSSLLETAGQRVIERAVVPTGKPALSTQLRMWIENPAIELVVGVVGRTMHAALLPLITKRLVGFNDLREIDGGQCGSTIVLLVPGQNISREVIDVILARAMRELRPRRSPTQPPPPPGSSVVQRRDLSAPNLATGSRSRPKTAPPPLPTANSDDYVETHGRPPEAEFERTVVATISPVRLEQLPVVVSPVVKPPRRPRYGTWIAIGSAAFAGALVGTVVGASRREVSPSAQPPTRIVPRGKADAAEPPPPAATDPSSTTPGGDPTAHAPMIEMPAVKIPARRPPSSVESAKPTAPVPSASEIWDPKSCDVISCGLDGFVRPCCQKFKQH